MGTHRIFAWHWHKEKWDSYTQKKRQKGVAVHTAFNVWHKSKQGGLQFQKKKRALCDSHTNLKRTVQLESWRVCVSAHTWEKSVAFTLKKENMVYTVYEVCDSQK